MDDNSKAYVRFRYRSLREIEDGIRTTSTGVEDARKNLNRMLSDPDEAHWKYALTLIEEASEELAGLVRTLNSL